MRTTSTTRTGWRMSPRAIFWAAMGGLVAAFLTGILAHMRGMIDGFAAALVGSDNVWVGWLVHLAAGVLVGALYGVFVATRNYGQGALFGGAYGLAVGLVLVLVLGNLIVRGGVPLDMTGAMQVMMHVGWGVVVGLVQAAGLRADESGGVERRRYRTA